MYAEILSSFDFEESREESILILIQENTDNIVPNFPLFFEEFEKVSLQAWSPNEHKEDDDLMAATLVLTNFPPSFCFTDENESQYCPLQ